MAIAEIGEVILEGEPRTYSATVKGADVARGMALAQYDNLQVKPAESGNRVIGIALDDAEVDEKVTYAIVGTGTFLARMILGESQTIDAGTPLKAGSTTIGGVTTNGHLVAQTDQSFSATVAKAEAEGLIAQLKAFVGFAVEDKTTGADTASPIKVLVKGASL